MRYNNLSSTLWIFPLVVIGTLSACSKDEHALPVAKVENRVITLGDYEKAINGISPEYLPSSTELPGLIEFLDKLIEKHVLALKADALGYDKDPKVVDGMDAFKGAGLQAGYLKLKIVDKLKATDKELKDAYEKYGRVLQVKQILTDTREEGEFAYDLLRQGHDFESVCKEYSRGPDAAEGGRTIGAIYGQFRPNFQDVVFNTPIGEVTKPIEVPYGFFIVKVVGQSQAPQKPYDELKPLLTRMVLQQQEMRLTGEMSERVREKHGFALYDDALKIILDAMPPDRPIDNPPPRDLEVYPILNLAVGDFDKPVATYLGKTITMKDFSDLYDRADFFARPRREYRLGGVRKFLTDIVMNEVVKEEIATSGIENEPQVAQMLTRKREELMVSVMFLDLVDKHTVIEFTEVEEYYNKNLEQFQSDERRRFQIVLAHDKKSADEARTRLLRGTKLETVQEEYATAEEIANTGLNDVLILRGEIPEIDKYGFPLLREGLFTEPFQISDGWVVAKLVEIRPAGHATLTEAQHEINHMLKERRNEERLMELLTKWKTEYEITVYEKNLKKAVVTARASNAHAAHADQHD
jgi:parvulin-like peptidyl-prolyl isomerase